MMCASLCFSSVQQIGFQVKNRIGKCVFVTGWGFQRGGIFSQNSLGELGGGGGGQQN